MNINCDIINNLHYSECYFKLLSQLTESPILDEESYKSIVSNIPSNHYIFVYNDKTTPIAMITLLIEQKLTHGGKCVCHIEDVVVDKKYNRKGIGSLIINNAVEFAKEKNCYKLILNCTEEVKMFYQKNGFVECNKSMSQYLNH
tara:strand:+ start:269 stop:700 length:432 start_codon:yes stop_codon:yes gene_type:complete